MLVFCPVKFNSKAFALEPNDLVYENKVYCAATIDDDFDGSSVIVLLDKNISELNKIHNKEFFGDVNIESIEDLSAVANPEKSFFNKEDFRQTLLLRLPQNDKETVLQVIEELELIEGIKYAGVNSNYASTRMSNDILYYDEDYSDFNDYIWPFEKIQLQEAWAKTTTL